MQRSILALALAGFVSVASAHDLERGPNGGPVVDVAGRHIEMVARGSELVLFLTDEAERPPVSAGARNAHAVVQDLGRTATVPIAPAEPNRLVGALAQPLIKGARVVVSATMADGRAVQARFVNP